MDYCIVIARYNENIEWAEQFSNVIIYNKGQPLYNNNETMLPNVGREGHTYYKYICDNYYNLKDYTIFLQGNPFDHSPNIIPNLNKYIDNINNKKLVIDFDFLSEWILECDLIDCPYHMGLPLKETYEKIFNEKRENKYYIFGAGAQFIVSKKCILNKPREFYMNIVNLLQNDINPIEGYVVERFHKMIFS